MSQRKSVFADILKKTKEEHRPAEAEVSPSTATGGHQDRAKKTKTNKATDPSYIKLTAYIPRELHTSIKVAMAEDGELD